MCSASLLVYLWRQVVVSLASLAFVLPLECGGLEERIFPPILLLLGSVFVCIALTVLLVKSSKG